MVHKALLLIGGGILLGKWVVLDSLIDKILPDKKTILIISLVLIGLGLYYMKKEGGLKLPKFLR